MDIAVLGAVIDPTGAVEGAAVATQAANSMAANMQSASGKAAAAQTTVGTSGRAMGQQVATGAQTAAAGVQTAANNPAWERMRAQARAVATGAGMAFAALRTSAVNSVSGIGSGFDVIRDRAAAAMRGTVAVVTSAFNTVRQQATAAANAAGASMSGILARVRGAFTGLGSGSGSVVDLANAFGLLNNPVGGAVSRLDSMRRILSGMPGFIGPTVAILGTLAAAFASVAAAVTLTFSAMSAAGPVQAATQGLEVVTGSAEQADAVLAALRENAIKTGADINASLDTSLKFIGLGFSPSDAVKLNSSIQDIAGTLGLSQARATELGNALAQVQSKGVVSMEELRQQIAEKGIPVFEELAKKMGVTQGQLIDMVGKGEVPAKKLIDIFLNLEGGFAKFAGGAEKATDKLPGAVNRAKAVWEDLLITMGTPINDAVAPILNNLSDMVLRLRPEFESLGNTIAGIFTAARPYLESFFEMITGKVQGLFAMFNSEAGFGTAWAVNIWTTFVDGGLTAISYVTAGFSTVGDVLLSAAATFVEYLAVVTTPEFWDMVGNSLSNAAIIFENGLRAAAEAFINFIIDNAPAWLTGGASGERADFGRLAVPTIPTANIVPPDIFDANNGTEGFTAKFERNLAGMESALDGTRQYWQQWGDDWNRQNLKPAADKITGKDSATLSTKGASGNDAPFDKDAASKAAKEAEKLQRQLEASARRYIEATRTPLEAYAATIAEVQALQQAGYLTLDQAAKASSAALDKLNKDTRRVAEEAAGPLEKLILKWGDVKTQIGEANASMTNSFADGMTNAITSIVTGTATAAEAWNQMTNAIIADITKTIIKLAIQWAIQQALGLVTGTAQPTTFTANSAATASAGVMHTGGVVGSTPGATRTVDSSVFAGARRYQHGGTVGGVASGERPIIAEDGEHVLTRDQGDDIRARLGGRKKTENRAQNVTILNITDSSMIEAAIAANPGIVLNAIGRNASKVNRLLKSS